MTLNLPCHPSSPLDCTSSPSSTSTRTTQASSPFDTWPSTDSVSGPCPQSNVAPTGRTLFSKRFHSTEMQSTNLGFLNPVQPSIQSQSPDKSDAFYDPSSADGYANHPHRSFLSDSASPLPAASPPALPDAQPSSPNQSLRFREPDFGASPLSSPHIRPASPHVRHHHRSSSFGSQTVSPPQAFRFPGAPSELNLAVQPLGQLGQITLDDNDRYPRAVLDQDALETLSSRSFYSQHNSHDNSPVLSTSAAPQYTANWSVTAPPPSHVNFSVAASPSNSELAPTSTPQLSVGIPLLSVSDTSMQYDDDLPTATDMPSIQVMAPSPSTPKATGMLGPHSGFQNMLAQLSAGTITQQSNSLSMPSSSSPSSASSSNWMPAGTDTFTSSSNQASAGLEYTNSGYQLRQGASWNVSQPLSHFLPSRRVPQGYHSDEPSQMLSDVYGQPSSAKVVYSPGQWSSQSKRKDSYDKIRQFLRLDVDMAFPDSPKQESPSGSSFRKRANSDIGPRSPTTTLAPGADINSGPYQAAANTDKGGLANHFGMPWESLKPKSDTQSLYMDQLSNPSSILTVQTAQVPQPSTMDPSLLNGAHRTPIHPHHHPHPHPSFSDVANQQPASGPIRQPRSYASSAQPFHLASYDGDAVVLPPVGTSPPQVYAGMGANTDPTVAFDSDWRVSNQATPMAGFDGTDLLPIDGRLLRRSQSARQAGHRRSAQSEDLSRFSRSTRAIPPDDFLSRITAPNGGLAPPSTGGMPTSTYYSAAAAASSSCSSSLNGSPRAHPYRTSHDRHHSFGSNGSGGAPMLQGGAPSFDSATAAARCGGGSFYSPTVLATHGSLSATSRSTSIASSLGSAGAASMLAAPPVPVVTSQATQAASASRRKTEALFACPVPGCGSTFTRQYNLRGHLRSHADERPFKCDWPGCDKSFARAHDCKRHQNLHLNIKPHTCEHCGKTFARLDALNRHHKSDTSGCLMKLNDGSSQADDAQAASAFHSNQFGGIKTEPIHQEKEEEMDDQARDGALSRKRFGGYIL